MVRELLVLLDEAEYAAIHDAAQRQQMSVSEWVRQALCVARRTNQDEVERKLQALEKASQCNHPTADIGQMLREIEAGQRAE